ncbi:MAG: MBL fold metallo-hydrolase [bacterium]|nr:MBL fold metallo-hydrolase [bacterium]
MVKVSFYGGAQEVTGSAFLFDDGRTKILADCGMFQCPRFCDLRSGEPFPFNPAEISALFVTHAHVDHTGRIPKLVRDGFRGKIFSSPPTKELARLMLEDSLGVMEKEARKSGGGILYGEEDIAAAFRLWEELEYHQETKVGDFRVKLLNSGHILGSAMLDIFAGGKRIVLTGDLGNPPTPLLPDPEEVRDANILIVESTYGDRLHEARGERKLGLERALEDTVKAGGVLMIPAFSLERTQELLFEINDLMEQGRVPKAPIFLDSPLAIKATEVYEKYKNYFNKEAHRNIKSWGDIFKLKNARFTLTTDQSKSINDVPAPKIVIAGSGMSTGGRILHHERRYLPDPKSALLFVGYQPPGSMGRRIQDGAKTVVILGEEVPVRAKIKALLGYSAHPDRDALLAFIEKSRDSLEKVFAIHGEPAASLFLVQRIRDHLGIEAYAPRYGETYEI